jgi:hypothetical protein
MAATTAGTVTGFLRKGYAVATWTNPYDGVSAVTVDADGMVRSALPIGDEPRFAMALETGGRAMNLLFPSPGICCAHGLVKRDKHNTYWQRDTSCACGLDPIGPNPPRDNSV